ncbi:MAG: ATP-binding cassette domain-containing protein, partial [Deltaproteobacteria bacterium]|nr:ATP-binding cassette domain-containing protein [Deltaproteobacteria bacterium]
MTRKTSDEVLLSVEDLKVSFKASDGYVEAVREISFELRPGERLALVGESGSGKSTVFNALLGMLPASA